MQANLELAVVDDCGWGGRIDRCGRLVWASLPRFDSDRPTTTRGGNHLRCVGEGLTLRLTTELSEDLDPATCLSMGWEEAL